MGGYPMKYLILLVILFGVLMVLFYRLKESFASLFGDHKPSLSARPGPKSGS